MKKKLKILLGAIGGLALLWLLAFGYQEMANANLREESYIETKPMLQGLSRLRPAKDEHIAYAPEGIYFEYYADEKGYELPKGWQPPGTVALAMVHRERGSVETSTFRFDNPPFPGEGEQYVRIAKVTLPELRRITFKSYFLGIFPQKGLRVGYGLFSREGMGALVKAYHAGSPDQINYVIMLNDLTPTPVRYIYAHWYDSLKFTEPSEIMSARYVYDNLLSIDLAEDQIARFPSEIHFVN